MSQSQSMRSARTNNRTSCGFCEGTHGQEPGRCYDASGAALTAATVPSRPNVGRGNAHAGPGEGLFDSGEAVGLRPAPSARAAPERYAHRVCDQSPHSRRQVIGSPQDMLRGE